MTSGITETGRVNFLLRNTIQLLLLKHFRGSTKLHGFACLMRKEVCNQKEMFFLSVACLIKPVK